MLADGGNVPGIPAFLPGGVVQVLPLEMIDGSRFAVPRQNMDSLEETLAHTFITKLWVEEVADDSGLPLWRGHITHVPSGQRYPVRELKDITSFIQAFLGDVNHRTSSRLSRLSKQWKQVRSKYRKLNRPG